MSKAPIDISRKAAQIITTNEENVNYLLSLNTNNRTIKKRHKMWLEEAVREEKFLLSNQGIGISSEGVLIDGQHRLTAIRDAGYPAVELAVITGIDPVMRLYLDQNAKRSIADALKIVLDENVSSRVTSTVTFLMRITEDEKEGFVVTHHSGRLSLEEVRKNVKKRLHIINEISEATASTCRAGTLAALVEYAEKWDHDEAMELAREVGFGENISAGDPGYKLRDVVLRKRGHGGGRGTNTQMVDYQQAVFCCINHAHRAKIERIERARSWAGLLEKQDNKRKRA